MESEVLRATGRLFGPDIARIIAPYVDDYLDGPIWARLTMLIQLKYANLGPTVGTCPSRIAQYARSLAPTRLLNTMYVVYHMRDIEAKYARYMGRSGMRHPRWVYDPKKKSWAGHGDQVWQLTYNQYEVYKWPDTMAACRALDLARSICAARMFKLGRIVER